MQVVGYSIYFWLDRSVQILTNQKLKCVAFSRFQIIIEMELVIEEPNNYSVKMCGFFSFLRKLWKANLAEEFYMLFLSLY